MYTSQSLSLSALEVLVHVDRSSVPGDLVRVEIEIPDALKNQRIEVKGLPRNWRSYPAPAALQRLGDGWLTENATAVLRVPSSLIPQESNFLVNPQHPDAGKIALISSAKFAYDARLNP